MENTIVNHVKVTDINFELIQDTFKKIDNFVAENEYQFKDRKGLDNITESNFKEAVANLSKKKRKKIAHYVWAINNYPTLGGINKFLHFLMTKVIKSDLRVRILKSDKEIAIQEKRKAYKQALEAMKKAHAEYKAEKGEFYKIRLSKNQAI